MLNSKYAPLVALTIVGALILGLIGYFLFISPAANKASEYRSDKGKVEQNTRTIQAEIDALKVYETDFESLPDIDALIEKNMPSNVDGVALEQRIADAITSSAVEIVGYIQSEGREFEPWLVDSSSLPSARISKLFETKELVPPSLGATTAAEPEVTTSSKESAISYEGAVLVPVTVTVAGSPSELDAFLRNLNPTDSPLLLIYSMYIEARTPGETDNGIRVAQANDAFLTVTIAQYVYGLDRTESVDRVPDPNIPVGGAIAP